MAEFGEQLKKAREEKGITQQTLAEMVYVTRQTISRYETGARYPDIVTLKKLSSVLGVSTDYLLGDEEVVKVVEKNPIIDKPLFNNIIIALYTLIVFAYAIFIINQSPLSSIAVEAAGNGRIYIYSLFITQVLSICLFMYGLFCALKGSMNSKKTGIIMALFLILEGSKALKYFTDKAGASLLIICVYVIGVICAYLFFAKKEKYQLAIMGVIGVSCFGICRQIYTEYSLLMYADHMHSWINSLLAFLTITIYVVFIYQAIVLNVKRKQADDLSQMKNAGTSENK